MVEAARFCGASAFHWLPKRPRRVECGSRGARQRPERVKAGGWRESPRSRHLSARRPLEDLEVVVCERELGDLAPAAKCPDKCKGIVRRAQQPRLVRPRAEKKTCGASLAPFRKHLKHRLEIAHKMTSGAAVAKRRRVAQLKEHARAKHPPG
eukprot:scaffold7121_cov121-Isochrysis_galbana.AAC.7